MRFGGAHFAAVQRVLKRLKNAKVLVGVLRRRMIE